MAKASTKAILQGKFKPWRKGKSVKSRKTGSLKNQLRSKKRLLNKITDEQQRLSIEDDIANLELAMEIRQGVDKEKKNASKYHQVKFVERQKLTRMEKKCKRNLDEARAAADFDDVEKHSKQLEQICMDQLYVAYYPNDAKYISLFADGVRLQDDEKTAKRREEVRNMIIKRIKSGEISTNKAWVNMEVLEAKGFIVDMKNMIADEGGKDGTVQMSAAMKEAAAAATKKKPSVPKSGNKSDSSSLPSSSDDESSSDEDDVQPSTEKSIPVKSKNAISALENKGGSNSDSSDSSSSDSGSSSSDSDSSNSSSSDSDSDEDNKDEVAIGSSQNENEEDEESDDDFLVDDSGDKDIAHVFANAKKEVEDYNVKGDKSKGWKTQRQLPGDFKKRRER
jgi:hypothetical protein